MRYSILLPLFLIAPLLTGCLDSATEAQIEADNQQAVAVVNDIDCAVATAAPAAEQISDAVGNQDAVNAAAESAKISGALCKKPAASVTP